MLLYNYLRNRYEVWNVLLQFKWIKPRWPTLSSSTQTTHNTNLIFQPFLFLMKLLIRKKCTGIQTDTLNSFSAKKKVWSSKNFECKAYRNSSFHYFYFIGRIKVCIHLPWRHAVYTEPSSLPTTKLLTSPIGKDMQVTATALDCLWTSSMLSCSENSSNLLHKRNINTYKIF